MIVKFSRFALEHHALEHHALEHHVLELSLNKVTIDEIEFEVLRNTTHVEEDSFMCHTHLVHEYVSKRGHVSKHSQHISLDLIQTVTTIDVVPVFEREARVKCTQYLSVYLSVHLSVAARAIFL